MTVLDSVIDFIMKNAQIGRLRVHRGSLLCLHTRLPFSESSAGPPTTSLRPEGLPKREAQRISNAKRHTSLRSYWHTLPKKRANPIEDESEVQQGHFCPPPFSRDRTWTLPLIQLPAGKQLAPYTKNGSMNESTSNKIEELDSENSTVDQDEYILDSQIHSHSGASALLRFRVLFRFCVRFRRGESRVAPRLTEFSESSSNYMFYTRAKGSNLRFVATTLVPITRLAL
ncbi:hypothetical protein Lal_00042395, partial [Lupinus albus]